LCLLAATKLTIHPEQRLVARDDHSDHMTLTVTKLGGRTGHHCVAHGHQNKLKNNMFYYKPVTQMITLRQGRMFECKVFASITTNSHPVL
jgi:hypothetical protein